jgi:hypothetical protein
MGHSISFKQLIEIIQKPKPSLENDLEMWDNISRTLSPPIPMLTHLSLSHPAPTISWPRLLAFAQLVPTLTHLSLAFWPVPCLTPNSRTAVIQGQYGQNIQYGSTNYYSHTLDDDFSEASDVIRRLAARLYGLEYLDLTGCTDWLKALQWTNDLAEEGSSGVDWGKQWIKMRTLRICSGMSLDSNSELRDVVRFVGAQEQAAATEELICYSMRSSVGKRVNWIEVEKDDCGVFDELWNGADSGDEGRKRKLLDQAKEMIKEGPWKNLVKNTRIQEVGEGVIERRSVWDQ